ncbi:MAG: Flp family type IVb pilin [Rhizomicrobium sp.]
MTGANIEKAADDAAFCGGLHAIVDKYNSIRRPPIKFAVKPVGHYAPARRSRRADFELGHAMKNLIQSFHRDEAGATAIEYGLIAALIAVIIIGAITVVGTSLSTTFSTVAASIK